MILSLLAGAHDLNEEVLVLLPHIIEGIPLLSSLFAFTDQNEPPIVEVPATQEFKGGLELLKKLVVFSQDSDNFAIPAKHLELLELVRLADFLGMDSFMESAARWLGVSVCAISNHNPVREVYQLIRGRYRACRHKKERNHGVCVWCIRPIYLDVHVPCRPEEPRRSPCCNLPVHPGCKPTAECRSCHQQLRVLPCVVCGDPISWGENFAREYEASLPHQTPCCGADCHPECKSDSITRCPLCSNPLTNWKKDKDYEMVGDILAAQRMGHLNDIRRRDNLPYDIIPLYKPIIR